MNYLLKLHDHINSIVRIEGIQELDNNVFYIEYLTEPNEQQLNQINTIISEWPLEKYKLEQLILIDNEWKRSLDQGWTTPYGWKLGLDTQDVTLLTGVFILAKEAHAMGLEIPAIIDMDGVSHQLDINDLTMLMLGYGQYRSQLSTNYSSQKTTINSLTSIP